MKFSYLLPGLLLLLNTVLMAQQKGSVKGTVKTSDGQPAAYVNVALQHTNKGVATDINGEYELRNLEAGNYTLQISFMGLETKEQPVEVVAGQTVVIPVIVLKEDQQALNEIVVTGYRTNPFDKKQSDYVTDKEYYSGWSTVNPQKPRSETASFTFRF